MLRFCPFDLRAHLTSWQLMIRLWHWHIAENETTSRFGDVFSATVSANCEKKMVVKRKLGERSGQAAQVVLSGERVRRKQSQTCSHSPMPRWQVCVHSLGYMSW